MNKLIDFIMYLIECFIAMGLTLVIVFVLDKMGYGMKDYIVLSLFLIYAHIFTYHSKEDK